MDEIAPDKITSHDPAAMSKDLLSENIRLLASAFPEVVADGKVDFDRLRTLLGDDVDDSDERFGLSWAGKRAALRLALAPSTATLRPDPASSVGWDDTQNLLIEGDNLEVLKLLQKSYAGQVKLIYIDPPYNTGNDFVYRDDYGDSVGNYLALTGQVDEAGAKLASNVETSGRFHTNWLNMMYPRLRLARDLLSNDGVMFVSIDDHEIQHLLSMVQDIYGADSVLATLMWNKQHSQQQGLFKRYHEYVVCVARNPSAVGMIQGGDGIIEAGALKRVSARNPKSSFVFPAGVRFDAPDGFELTGTYGGAEQVEVLDGRLRAANGRTLDEVTLAAGWTQRTQMESWFRGEDTVDSKGQTVLEFFFNAAGKLKCRKQRGSITPPTILPEFGMVSEQTRALAELMGAEVFGTPKPVAMLRMFMEWFACGPSDIVMDFFAGSGTTGHAVMEQNAEDGGTRRYILVQLPEPLSSGNEGQKAAAEFCEALGAPLNIAELTKERLRRAGAKVREEHPAVGVDTGFRVYTLDSSNITEWDPNIEALEGTIDEYIDRIKNDRSEHDIRTEVLLKLGIDLVTPIEVRQIGDKTVSSIGAGVLFTCLDPFIDRNDAEGLAQGIVSWREELNPEGDATVVFRDDAFVDDVAKSNLAEILVQHGFARENIRSL